DAERVTVGPRTTVRVPADLTVTRPRVVGHRNRMTYAVAALGDQAPARFSATLTSRPMLGSGALRVLALVVVVAVWLTGVVVGVPFLSRQLSEQQDGVVAADGAATDPDGNGAPG